MTELEQAIEGLSSGSEADRIYAAEDIGCLNQGAGVQPLLERLEVETSRVVRESIFTALGRIGDRTVITGLIAMLDSHDSFLRNQAVEGLKAHGARAVPLLERAFVEGDADRRKMVLDALTGIDGPSLEGIYRRALADPDLNVLITAVENLGNTRKSQFREEIEVLASSECHPMLLAACINALAEIGDAHSLEVIRRSLANQPPPDFLRPGYLRLLGAAGSPRDAYEIAGYARAGKGDADWIGALTKLCERHPGLPLPETLVEPLDATVGNARSPLEAYRAVRLLGGLAGSSAAAAGSVDRCLDDPEKAIRIGAIEALRLAGLAEENHRLERRRAIETDEEVLQILGLERP